LHDGPTWRHLYQGTLQGCVSEFEEEAHGLVSLENPFQGVYSQSHAYGFTISLVMLWLRCLSVSRHSGCLFSISRNGFTINLVLLRCLFSVSRPVRVSILNLMLMVLPLIWFPLWLRCLSVSRPFRVSVLNLTNGFTINLVPIRRLFSVSRPVRVSILNLMLMVLPLIWFC
jgi:hypothetical protein